MLFFLHAGAMAAYAVPFPNVLDAHGLGAFAVLAVGTGSVAAFISPMIVGTLADRKFSPERLLATLTFLSGTLLILVHCAVQFGWGTNVFLSLMMAYALSNAPGFSLVTSVVMSRLSDARRQFGPIRVWATIGWMVASMVVGIMLAPQSPAAGYVGGGIFLAESIFCLTLRPTRPPEDRTPRRLRDYFGWDAMILLRHPDHRLIFFTSALFSALLSTFYLYTVRHLKVAGDAKPALTMGVAQFFEGVATFGLAAVLLRFRIKWVLTAALFIGVLRFALLALDKYPPIVASVCLHGPLFVLYYLTCQIYLEQRVDSRIRSQSQALLSLMNSGVGNLVGYTIIAWWYEFCRHGNLVDWPRFWGVLGIAAGLLTIMFVIGYKGRKRI
ncbi:MAG TPA: MFS transporter [Verrucomicrobiales bacterium]|nr:MFS transporter [Verrucomicrobiales bacterium]